MRDCCCVDGAAQTEPGGVVDAGPWQRRGTVSPSRTASHRSSGKFSAHGLADKMCTEACLHASDACRPLFEGLDACRPPDLATKTILPSVLSAYRNRVSGLLAIRIKGALGCNYSFDTVPWIDRFAFNAEIIRLVLQNKCVAARG